jgi:hypothetical protein
VLLAFDRIEQGAISMPEQDTLERAHGAASTKQAIAIGLSQARRRKAS